MRIMALTRRILRQIVRDKRTMGLLIMAPILVMTLLYLVFEGEDYVPNIGFAGLPVPLTEQIDREGAQIREYEAVSDARKDLEEGSLDAYLTIDGSLPQLVLEGSDPTVNGEVMTWLRGAFPESGQSGPKTEVHYLHGSSDMGVFDYFGPVLLGFFVFFFVFLIAGVSFLRERTTGTLDRLLVSPLRKWEIVTGYMLGFGLFTIIQASLIAVYTIYVLGMVMEGNFLLVLLVIVLLSFTALSLGILLSTFANNELQMIQFIPLVIVPQIFFSGLFNLDTIADWLSWIGRLTPLYYAADALRAIMVRGEGVGAIGWNLVLLACFSLLFVSLNILLLRKYRKI
ncbi:ABC transporter permease [Bhargavaea cecembensis]|uniref:ABC transporter permease n=1 Tax=Bhargavaea cecembensis TaxID=394098 RepID=A0A165HK87_9BACL|nr:ABC transporter permease [Bhargavaea cecembensis]KZE40284.1 ABC transporter permease [Bhargavaea cecembensis]